MAIADHNHQSGNNNSNGSTPPSTSSASASSALYHHHVQNHAHGSNSVSTRRCPELDPAAKLYFSHEPGKQARSSINIKISGKSYIAFKHQKLLHASSRGCTRFRGKYYCNNLQVC
uniref:Vesicle-associated protein 4-2 n=1 Tax=Rhizophora mucronata TaxID=61149 RepID=A0A2P2JUL1_RHIMU